MAGDPLHAAAPERQPRRAMHDEARELIDAADADGLTLRLLGGLAVRRHCRTAELCARDYSDLDMVGRAREARRLPTVFAGFGYREDRAAARATGNTQLRFVRACRHLDPGGAPAHDDDHVDVFLDTFRMDHDVELAGRLDRDPYTLSVSDLLLTKLQIVRLNEKDVRDIVTLLDGATVSDSETPGAIDAGYIARLCADDWGLFHDVGLTLQAVGKRVDRYDLSAAEAVSVRQGLARLVAAMSEAPKTMRFRLRARLGTRVRWHNQPDEQD